ncbi:MAG: hypothetical protein OXI13_05720 [Gammaproteobacteria bacterium]|nr:hypothetical protein [Gammaproteobacteria bacterium]
MSENIAQPANRAFLLGLFFITGTTLMLEVLNTRLLSVVTWYHLSFFAVSMAMFGMAAGALQVYLQPRRFTTANALDNLFRYSIYFGASAILCHLAVIYTPLDISEGWSAAGVAKMALITVAVAIPFFFSGVVVTVALTQVKGNSGLIYAVDLVGAAVGSIACLPLLNALDITSATFVVAAIALFGVFLFQLARGGARPLLWTAAGAAVIAAAIVNHSSSQGFRVFYPKGNPISYEQDTLEFWTIHGQVLVFPYVEAGPFFWGPGEGAPVIEGMQGQAMVIDGEAGTALTQWDGDRSNLDWPRFDVTSLPYHLRPGGSAAVIGVGGGRDVLTALWAGSSRITAIEINEAALRVLREDRRDFVRLYEQEEVEFVHDEARSYLTRANERYGLIQMSLIDTWAATGAGAFTLSENGLYTVEGWQVFLDHLEPNGLLSVSRWYSLDALSETNRLISLAAMSLLRRGIERPADHIALVSRLSVATLLVSPEPLAPADIDTIERVAEEYGFTIHHTPRQQSSESLIRNLLAADDERQLLAATEHEYLDFTPPTDSRPYFFNILKPAALFQSGGAGGELEDLGIVAGGNLLATYTLMLLCGLALAGVLLVIFFPLLIAGRPQIPNRVFLSGLAYFACIGTGFMMVQIPLMQRFSVYLGHPVYAVAVLLFSMILAAGAGSFLSDRIEVRRGSRWPLVIPAVIVSLLALIYAIAGPLITATISQGLFIRCLIVIVLVSLPALPMGMCFPLGLRLFREYSSRSLPWMWGMNGATGVLASVFAVAISMWSGINTSLLVAIACYALLALPASILQAKMD